jgi:hypothetical protein
MFIFAYCAGLWLFGALPVHDLSNLIAILCFGGLVFNFQVAWDRSGEEMKRNKPDQETLAMLQRLDAGVAKKRY